MWKDVESKGNSERDQHVTIAPNTTKLLHILLKVGEEPHSYWTHYIPSKNPTSGPKGRVVICPGKDVCPACKAGIYRTKRQHAIVVYDFESKSARILEQGNQVMQQLKMIYDQFNSFDNIDISIRRIGTDKNTQYVVIPIPRKEPFDMTLVSGGLPQVKSIKIPTTVEAIENIINDLDIEFDPAKYETENTAEKPPQEDETIKTPKVITLPWGKYQGKTLEDVALQDLNYVKWCANNITDPEIKAEAERVYNLHTQKPTNQPTKQHIGTIINDIQTVLNMDGRYKSNYTLVVEKMKEATKSQLNPNGKTILQEYTVDEALKLLELLRK